MNIDAVEEGPTDSTPIALDLSGRAPTFPGGVPQIAAGTGIHGGDQHERAGESDFSCASGDGHIGIFQRLAKDFEGGSFEFGEFIEKEHPVMGQGNLTWSWNGAAPQEPDVADGVMG